MNLIIVESPTKAKTISKLLGRKFTVTACLGHVRDLPKSKLGIDLEKNFEPQYIIPIKIKKRVSELKKEAKKAKNILLATDKDREGEAIAWHLSQVLNLEDSKTIKVERIAFHEITKTALEEALKNPREINMDLVAAQQARRILDRLVGYKLSPFLWDKIMKRLSAGRVQSVALRFIAEREEEINNFTPQEYWSIVATFLKAKNQESKKEDGQFEASLYKINDKIISKLDIINKESAEKIVKELKQHEYQISNIEQKEIKKNPLPPFTTSSLQQEASRKLRFSAKQTMRAAQNLYENGLITYMRTDSLNLAPTAVLSAKSWIEKNLGKDYITQAPRFFKTKTKLSQEAHEAIRPTNPEITYDNIDKQKTSKAIENAEIKLYKLIWQRFIASQLPQAQIETTTIEIESLTKSKEQNNYTLKTTGSVLKFDGFLKIWPTQLEEKIMPFVQKNDVLKLIDIFSNQHFTEPPSRYDEASLVKKLEESGIGRPSTYAPIISVIQNRNYVIKNDQRRFAPTEIGIAVDKILLKHFPEIVDIQFTAKMENELDFIAQGKTVWQEVIKDFYFPFSKNLEQKYQEVEKQKPVEEKTDIICEKCNSPMIVKYGRFGKFLACSNFPQCKSTKSFSNISGIKCPECIDGDVVERRSKKGRMFYGCSKWPNCNFLSNKKPTGKICAHCGKYLIEERNKIKCSNKICTYDYKNRDNN